MEKINKRLIGYSIFAACSLVLFIISPRLGGNGDFLVGLASGFIAVSVLRIVQIIRYKTDETYAKDITIKYHDERNLFLAEKARSLTFRYGILVAAAAVIVLFLAGLKNEGRILSYFVCGNLFIYWITYYLLRKKY
ncbi:MAG: hypothetical protein VB120_03440 [Lachnospiraceae bacterium]|nr:hypothetical protein [Lachnospiraceae bacterium]